MSAETPAAGTGVRAWARRLVEHRRGLARVLLGAGVLVVVEQLVPFWPRRTELELDLGARHGEVHELRLSYVQGGEELKGVSLHYAAGAPSRVHHSVDLPSGEVSLMCELRGADGASTILSRALRTPTDGVLRVSAEPSWETRQ